ncbi:MAG: hypothetical protein ACRD0A_02590 [Acidimicrobiales bacterium]
MVEATGEVGAVLLDQVDAVRMVRGPAPPAFLAGTSLALPGHVFINTRLLDDRVRLAEHLLHEAVHVTLYRTYFGRTPLRRGYVLGPHAVEICAAWHNPGLDEADSPSWWGAERSLHAFVVHVHLAAFWLALKRLGIAPAVSGPGLRASIFCAAYLSARLRGMANEVFVPATGEFVSQMGGVIPVPPTVTEAVDRYDGRGMRWIERAGRASPGGPAATVVDVENHASGTFVLTDRTAYSVTSGTAGLCPERSMVGASLNEYLALESPDAVLVDGDVLTEMLAT